LSFFCFGFPSFAFGSLFRNTQMNSIVDYASSSDEDDDDNEMTLKRKERSNTPQEEQKE
jgi:hypothetical protein